MWVLPAGPHPALTGLGDVTGSVVSGDRSHILIYRGSRASACFCLRTRRSRPARLAPASHTGVDSAWHLGSWAWATSLNDGSTPSGCVAVETGLPGPVSSPVKQLSRGVKRRARGGHTVKDARAMGGHCCPLSLLREPGLRREGRGAGRGTWACLAMAALLHGPPLARPAGGEAEAPARPPPPRDARQGHRHGWPRAGPRLRREARPCPEPVRAPWPAAAGTPPPGRSPP